MMKIKFLKASRGDCFLISFQDTNNVSRNILIDGGINDTYFETNRNCVGELKLEIERIKREKQKVDLLIITHIDDDHIWGLLKWFEMDKEAYNLVKNVWFNSGKLIAEYLKEPENPDLNLGLKIFNTAETCVAKAIDFEKYLLDHGIWKRKLVRKGFELDELGVKFEVLSPNDEQLNMLLKKFKRETGNPTYTEGSLKDWNLSLKALIKDEESNYITPKDTSPTNSSSITFILSVRIRKFLFLADAPSDEIVKVLNDMGYNKEKQLCVEFMKVSHHGSKNNTSNELLEIVKTNHYLISTDSSFHGHPNKRTLARIFKYNPNATFHFNYDHVRRGVFNLQDFKDFKTLKTHLTPEFKIENE